MFASPVLIDRSMTNFSAWVGGNGNRIKSKMAARYREKRTLITMVCDQYLSSATFLTPLIFHYPLPLNDYNDKILKSCFFIFKGKNDKKNHLAPPSLSGTNRALPKKLIHFLHTDLTKLGQWKAEISRPALGEVLTMKVRPFAVTRKTRPEGRPFTWTRLTSSNSSTSFHITLQFSTFT